MGTAELILQDQTEHDDTGDEYYYGYRTIIGYDENGEISYTYRPLTLDDFLEPEEGDVYMQGSLHTEDVIRLRGIFIHHLKNRGNITVFCDLKIEWGIEDLQNPAPDISIFENVRDPEKPRGTFSVPEEGVSPFFILEVVSPRYRSADIKKKPVIYRKAGVSEYIIADPNLKGDKVSYTVSGYRLIGNRYVKTEPDSQGRIRSLTTNVLIGPAESGTRLAVYDTVTGEEILSDDERAEQEKTKAEKEKARAEREKAKAEREKAKAEREKAKAEREKAKAEKEKAKAESAEEELMRLKAKMKALGISAD